MGWFSGGTMSIWSSMGKAFLGETAYQTFNNYLSNIVRKRNASIVGPSKQITGEFPEVDFFRLYEFYHGWDQIKRSIDTAHQKFMGAGIKITSKDEEFTTFMDKWCEIVNFQKKMGEFFLSLFITGNAILELQFTDEKKIGNIEQIPMQTIYRVFRDEFATDIKIVQNIDGIFKELDPANYVRFTINNPDRQAFGKSEFNTLAQPRKVSATIDPSTGQAINPERTTVSLLDAQAELQNAEVEIKKLMAKPRVFASFPGMQREQLDKLQKELEDPASKQWIWAFDKEAKMAEAQIQANSKFDDYGDNVDSHIDIGTGFASKVVSKPGGFSYSSSQTPFDVLDQRMLTLQSDAIEVITDQILRPVAESWGFEDFDDYDVEVTFKPSPRRLTVEDLQKLPRDAVSPYETREILKGIHITLDDELYKAWLQEQKEQRFPQIQTPTSAPKTTSPTSSDAPAQKATASVDGHTQIDPEHAKNRPTPTITHGFENHPLANPTVFESYMKTIVSEAVTGAIERITIGPKINTSDLYVPGGLGDEQGQPEITDVDIATRLQTELEFDPTNPEQEDPSEEPLGPADRPEQTSKDGTPAETPLQTGNRDLTSGLGNQQFDQRVQDNANPHTTPLGDDNPERALQQFREEQPKKVLNPNQTSNKFEQPDTSDLLQSGTVNNPLLEKQKGAYRGKNAPNPNDDIDITGPITNEEPQKTQAVPKQVPKSINDQLRKELTGDGKNLGKLLGGSNGKQRKTRVGEKRAKK